jgi:hypothetical protein
MSQKPRIRLVRKLWLCGMWDALGHFGLIGLGYTPKQAYQDWIYCNAKSGRTDTLDLETVTAAALHLAA